MNPRGILSHDAIRTALRAGAARNLSVAQLRAMGDSSPVLGCIEDVRRRAELDRKRVDLAKMLYDLKGFPEVYQRTVEAAYRSEGTRQSYKQYYKRFIEWCAEEDLPAAPISSEIVAHFILHEANKPDTKPQRLKQLVAGIRFYESWLQTSRDDLLLDSLLVWIEDRFREEQEKIAKEAATNINPATATESVGPREH
jgi:hypothetical protein